MLRGQVLVELVEYCKSQALRYLGEFVKKQSKTPVSFATYRSFVAKLVEVDWWSKTPSNLAQSMKRPDLEIIYKLEVERHFKYKDESQQRIVQLLKRAQEETRNDAIQGHLMVAVAQALREGFGEDKESIRTLNASFQNVLRRLGQSGLNQENELQQIASSVPKGTGSVRADAFEEEIQGIEDV